MPYLWCMRAREDKKQTDVNQKRAVEVCKKLNCEYLEVVEGDEEIHCTCPPSLQYVDAFKGNWKKRRVAESEEE